MTDDLKKSSEVENIYKILESGFQENKSIKQYALPNARQWLGARFSALWVIPIYLLKKLNKISNSSVFVKPYTPSTNSPSYNQPETLFRMVEKKPITPSAKELRENIPSRSAKLRYVIKKNDFYNFETDIVKKFKTLLDIENFGEKL